MLAGRSAPTKGVVPFLVELPDAVAYGPSTSRRADP
jgi:hypothetical protein